MDRESSRHLVRGGVIVYSRLRVIVAEVDNLLCSRMFCFKSFRFGQVRNGGEITNQEIKRAADAPILTGVLSVQHHSVSCNLYGQNVVVVSLHACPHSFPHFRITFASAKVNRFHVLQEAKPVPNNDMSNARQIGQRETHHVGDPVGDRVHMMATRTCHRTFFDVDLMELREQRLTGLETGDGPQARRDAIFVKTLHRSSLAVLQAKMSQAT